MVKKIKLYQGFIDSNTKYSNKIFSFIKRNCIIANFKINDLENIKLDKAKEIKLAALRDYDSFFNDENRCDNCNLCDRFVFKEKRKLLKSNMKKLFIRETNDSEKEKILDDITQELNLISFHIKKDIKGKFCKTILLKNLYQRIIDSFIDDVIKKLNNEEDVEEYFLQVARILINTKEFKKDINNIRKKFFKRIKDRNSFTDYLLKDQNLTYSINQNIEKILNKYNLAPRWENWVNSLLYYDQKKILECTIDYLPTGSLGIRRIFEKNKGGLKEIGIEPIYVGDETKEELERFKRKYGKDVSIDISKKRRKPIFEFEKYLRWYKLYEKGKKPIDIYDIDKQNHPGDWKDLLSYDCEARAETIAMSRIQKGIQDLRDRIKKPK